MCPLLLRVFPRRGGHHRLEEFARRGDEPDGELTMYTWPDATLRELTDLVKEVRAFLVHDLRGGSDPQGSNVAAKTRSPAGCVAAGADELCEEARAV